MPDYAMDDRSARLVREIKPGQMRSFYAYTDRAFSTAGVVVAQAQNEASKKASARGEQERKKRRVKPFCRGIILCNEEDTLIFVRYSGSLDTNRLEKLLKRKMGRDTLLGRAGKRLKSAQIMDRKEMEADESGSFTEQLRVRGVDLDTATASAGPTPQELLTALEADFLSEETYQAELNKEIAAQFQPLARILGITVGDAPSPEVVSAAFTAALAGRDRQAFLDEVLDSTEATEAAIEILGTIGQGLEPGEDAAEAEYAGLAVVMKTLEDDINSVLIYMDAAEDAPSAAFPEIIECYQQQAITVRSQPILVAARVVKGMTWIPLSKTEPLHIRPFSARIFHSVEQRVDDLEEDLTDLLDRVSDGDDPRIAEKELTAIKERLRAADASLCSALIQRDPPLVIKYSMYPRIEALTTRAYRMNKRIALHRRELKGSGTAVALRAKLISKTLLDVPFNELFAEPAAAALLQEMADKESATDSLIFLRASERVLAELESKLGTPEPIDFEAFSDRFLKKDSKSKFNISFALVDAFRAISQPAVTTRDKQALRMALLSARKEADTMLYSVKTKAITSMKEAHLAGDSSEALAFRALARAQQIDPLDTERSDESLDDFERKLADEMHELGTDGLDQLEREMKADLVARRAAHHAMLREQARAFVASMPESGIWSVLDDSNRDLTVELNPVPALAFSHTTSGDARRALGAIAGEHPIRSGDFQVHIVKGQTTIVVSQTHCSRVQGVVEQYGLDIVVLPELSIGRSVEEAVQFAWLCDKAALVTLDEILRESSPLGKALSGAFANATKGEFSTENHVFFHDVGKLIAVLHNDVKTKNSAHREQVFTLTERHIRAGVERQVNLGDQEREQFITAVEAYKAVTDGYVDDAHRAAVIDAKPALIRALVKGQAQSKTLLRETFSRFPGSLREAWEKMIKKPRDQGFTPPPHSETLRDVAALYGISFTEL